MRVERRANLHGAFEVATPGAIQASVVHDVDEAPDEPEDAETAADEQASSQVAPAPIAAEQGVETPLASTCRREA